MSPSHGDLLEGATNAMQRHFGHASLRDFQVEALEAWARGQDALLAVGTGAGKSLCFQLPALLGCRTLVVSPLISLMQDQQRTLRQRGIPCGLGMECFTGHQLVYMSPEFALSHLAQLASMSKRTLELSMGARHDLKR